MLIYFQSATNYYNKMLVGDKGARRSTWNGNYGPFSLITFIDIYGKLQWQPKLTEIEAADESISKFSVYIFEQKFHFYKHQFMHVWAWNEQSQTHSSLRNKSL